MLLFLLMVEEYRESLSLEQPLGQHPRPYPGAERMMMMIREQEYREQHQRSYPFESVETMMMMILLLLEETHEQVAGTATLTAIVLIGIPNGSTYLRRVVEGLLVLS